MLQHCWLVVPVVAGSDGDWSQLRGDRHSRTTYRDARKEHLRDQAGQLSRTLDIEAVGAGQFISVGGFMASYATGSEVGTSQQRREW